MAKMISHHRIGDKGTGLDRVSEYNLTYKCHRNRKIQPMIVPELEDDVSDDDFYSYESLFTISWTTTNS